MDLMLGLEGITAVPIEMNDARLSAKLLEYTRNAQETVSGLREFLLTNPSLASYQNWFMQHSAPLDAEIRDLRSDSAMKNMGQIIKYAQNRFPELKRGVRAIGTFGSLHRQRLLTFQDGKIDFEELRQTSSYSINDYQNKLRASRKVIDEKGARLKALGNHFDYFIPEFERAGRPDLLKKGYE